MDAYKDVAHLVTILMRHREPYDNHGTRVAQMARRLAIAAQLPTVDVHMVEMGAYLHDVGKLLLPDQLINTTRKLNTMERLQMQSHVKLGGEIVKEAGYHAIIQNIVLYHQEKWDGSGYPFGLKENQIPLEAQLIAVCDVFEAMTNSRPYRESNSIPFTRAYMESRSGLDFNPKLIDLFFTHVVTGEIYG